MKPKNDRPQLAQAPAARQPAPRQRFRIESSRSGSRPQGGGRERATAPPFPAREAAMGALGAAKPPAPLIQGPGGRMEDLRL